MALSKSKRSALEEYSKCSTKPKRRKETDLDGKCRVATKIAPIIGRHGDVVALVVFLCILKWPTPLLHVEEHFKSSSDK